MKYRSHCFVNLKQCPTLVYDSVFALFPATPDVVSVEVVNNDWLILFYETTTYVTIIRRHQFPRNDHRRWTKMSGR